MVLLLVLARVASAPFLDQLLSLFHYPSGSSAALLDGTLPLRYCSVKFAAEVPFWVPPVPGHVFGLLTVHDQVAAWWCSGYWSWFWISEKEISTNQKNTCTPRWSFGAYSSTCVEEVAFFWGFVFLKC